MTWGGLKGWAMSTRAASASVIRAAIVDAVIAEDEDTRSASSGAYSARSANSWVLAAGSSGPLSWTRRTPSTASPRHLATMSRSAHSGASATIPAHTSARSGRGSKIRTGAPQEANSRAHDSPIVPAPTTATGPSRGCPARAS